MVISDKKFVAVSYDLFVPTEEGGQELMEKATKERPLKFTFGMGMMLEPFEDHLKNLTVGDKFDFELTPDEAYGDFEEARVVDLDKSIFTVDGVFDDEHIAVDRMVPMMDSEGNRLNGIVLDITDTKVKMDFNHPLAGETLHFVGEVLEVREPTAEELAVLTHRCSGGGCGNCGGGDCGSGCGSEGGCNGCGK